MLFKKKQQARTFDRDTLRPVIRSSICTGEKVAGFQNRHTGKISDVMLIRTAKDLEDFQSLYGIAPQELTTLY